VVIERTEEPAVDLRPAVAFVPWLVAVTALGLAVRLVAVAFASRDLPFDDGLWYHGVAHILAEGHGYLSPGNFIFQGKVFATAEHPPLYPGLLAVMVWLGHGSVLGLQVTTAVVGAAGVPVIGLLGRRVGGPRVGLVAAFLCAVAPNIWRYDAVLLSESILALTLGLYLLCLYRFWDRPTVIAATLAGLTLALAGYNRAELFGLGLLAIPLVVRNPRLSGAKVRVGRLAAIGLVAVALAAPWTIRNLTVFDRTVWFTDNLDSVMAGANCKEVYSGPHIGEWNSRCNAAVFRKGWDESVAFSEARHAGILYLRRHADELPLVVVARIGREWQLWAPFDHIGTGGRGNGIWIASAASFWLMSILGVFGAVQLHRARRLMWPLASIAGFVTVLAAVTYGTARLRAPFDVALLVLAAVPIVSFWSRRTGRPSGIEVPPGDAASAAPEIAAATESASPLTTRN
jgi:4-amino-4-deoxy-L-arabinose transferase-like glycosyltransferase